MAERGVKVAAVACNTISTLIDSYREGWPFKIFSVVESGAYYAASLDIKSVGVIGTCFTAKSGAYNRLINSRNPKISVVAAGCPNLARLIDAGRLDPKFIDPELTTAVDDILRQIPTEHLILLCTHYPLVAERIHALYPQLNLIDPARQQALDIKSYLAENGLLMNLPEAQLGEIDLNTSGSVLQYAESAARFGVKEPRSICHVVAIKADSRK